MKRIQVKSDINDIGSAKETEYHRFIVYVCSNSRAVYKFRQWMKQRECLSNRYDDSGIPLPCQENVVMGIGQIDLLQAHEANEKTDEMRVRDENAYDIWIPALWLNEFADIVDYGMRDKHIMRKIVVSVELPTSQKIPFGMGKMGFSKRELMPAEKAESRKYALPSVQTDSCIGKDMEVLDNGGRNIVRRIKLEWQSNSGFKKAEKRQQSVFVDYIGPRPAK